MNLASIIIEDTGAPGVVVHNMPCAICRAAKAVYDCNEGIFKPCWKCQETWETRRIPWYARAKRQATKRKEHGHGSG